ncbi:MAG: hypothetical protein A3A80_02895 [Candidatus Terrybacteria bacterium RIFCSPLOWO2_01_FULL_44_24]|uniref:DUF4446 domain-containing protein n=1 Tax=Candidatus Terrybacteria bacterium RIFCSPHIGHO2_01_FULL_43_35 TaxID=1802361 RepID=A0A1G2PF28_9BACT|nr:MAG: hypothetical protein A2828_03080 [Candidatus Terrybacteria bacterium RIFCSPHIGHO2_01_FULL_43_35]OHA50235.1 MAG: hypothetical protein A3B75_00315 [Candidatus Terrybacteria bacterium RIFCSPHIGHO2_02_FULL_43_14]OHA51014.1 MAG: hypothetical protein A3A80_02895 [Candidatus Terrybacteria bacterium RIFCSPLOWO2_01_FULL_44_24]
METNTSTALILIAVISFIASCAAIAFVFVLKQRFDAFFHKGKGEGLEGVLAEQGKKVRDMGDELKRIRNDVARIDVMAEASIQKVGAVRFNPFDDTGGDQSFAAALLDSADNGIVISSLHSREGTRVYAKSVIKGESRHHLTEEEREAIRRAIAHE